MFTDVLEIGYKTCFTPKAKILGVLVDYSGTRKWTVRSEVYFLQFEPVREGIRRKRIESECVIWTRFYEPIRDRYKF